MANGLKGEDESSRVNPQPNAARERAGPVFAEPEIPTVDLAAELLKVLPKSRGERVTSRRITGNYYRCNWWAPSETEDYDNPTMTGLTVTTHRIVRSQLLHVVKTAAGLEITPANQS